MIDEEFRKNGFATAWLCSYEKKAGVFAINPMEITFMLEKPLAGACDKKNSV
jgi:hypothetical protein